MGSGHLYGLCILLLGCAVLTPLKAGEWEYAGDTSIGYMHYTNTHEAKREDSGDLTANLTFQRDMEDSAFVARFEMVRDSEDENRNYLYLNEIYYRFYLENSDIQVGKSVLFWGSLEAYNITDVFNVKNLLYGPYSPYDKEKKLGSWNTSLRYNFESGDQAVFIVKLSEENQALQDEQSPYTNFPFEYDPELLTESSRNRPTVYFKYDGTTSEGIQGDYSVTLYNGYNDAREYVFKDFRIRQEAYLVNKLLTYDTVVIDDTIIKLEAAFTDVISDDTVEDYYQLGVGAEYTFFSFFGDRDITLFSEYYRSDNKTASLFFQNDLFAGFRLKYNDSAGSELNGGVVNDMEYRETLTQFVYRTKPYPDVKLELEYLNISSGGDKDSLFKEVENHSALNLIARYYF